MSFFRSFLRSEMAAVIVVVAAADVSRDSSCFTTAPATAFASTRPRLPSLASAAVLVSAAVVLAWAAASFFCMVASLFSPSLILASMPSLDSLRRTGEVVTP